MKLEITPQELREIASLVVRQGAGSNAGEGAPRFSPSDYSSSRPLQFRPRSFAPAFPHPLTLASTAIACFSAAVICFHPVGRWWDAQPSVAKWQKIARLAAVSLVSSPEPRAEKGAKAKREEIVRLAIRRSKGPFRPVTRAYSPEAVAQCANFVRDVLAEAGVSLPVSAAPVDGISPTGYSLANSLAGRDIGSVIKDPQKLRPGDLVFWKNTYTGWWPESAITHVGFYVGGGKIVDKGNAPTPHQRSLYAFPRKDFIAGIRIHRHFLVGASR